jgi:hypothetical protein
MKNILKKQYLPSYKTDKIGFIFLFSSTVIAWDHLRGCHPWKCHRVRLYECKMLIHGPRFSLPNLFSEL